MDSIHLNGIRVYGYTGLLPEEQTLGQWFSVDLTLRVDVSSAGASDRLEDTVDYREVITQVQALIQSAKFALLERLATTIAAQVLTDPDITQVTVKLTKLAPPIPDFSGQITIELTRPQLSERRTPSLEVVRRTDSERRIL